MHPIFIIIPILCTKKPFTSSHQAAIIVCHHITIKSFFTESIIIHLLVAIKALLGKQTHDPAWMIIIVQKDYFIQNHRRLDQCFYIL